MTSAPNWFLNIGIFILVLSAILSIGYFYLKRRLIALLPFSEKLKKKMKLFLFIMVYSPSFVVPLHLLENKFSDVMHWYAFISLGAVSFLVTLTFLRDIALFFWFLLSKVKIKLTSKTAAEGKPEARESTPSETALSRREFFMQAANRGVLSLTSGLTAYGIYEARKIADFVSIRVPIKNLPREFHGFKITQITDIHVGATIKRKYIQGIVQAVNHTKPDMVAITGDLVDGSVKQLQHDVEPLKDIQSKHGSYFVTGNHEYYSGALEWVKAIQDLGIRVLLNEHVILKENNSHLIIAGVNDYTAQRILPEHKTDPFKAIEKCEVDGCKILLAHQPRSIFKAAEAGYDLQISGHTHGGQFFPWNYFVRLVQPFTQGLHLYKNTWIYVNKGTGYWGPPIRVGAPSEITEITLSQA